MCNIGYHMSQDFKCLENCFDSKYGTKKLDLERVY